MSIREALGRFIFSVWYYFRPPWDTGVSPPELLDYLDRQAPGKALDLGCGTGTNALTMAQKGWQVTGVDFAPRAIRLARRKARSAGLGVDFRRGDVTRLEGILGPFDLILDIGCFHGLDPGGRKGYLENLRRLLAAGGTYLVYANIKGEPQSWGPGISEEELELPWLRELAREYGTNRGKQTSAWFTLQWAQPTKNESAARDGEVAREQIDG